WRGSASELSVGITLTPPSSTLFPYPTLFRSYPAVTTRFFHRFGLQPEVVPLHGSIELAPLVGLADGVVDITETGRTLRANGLRIVEEIAPISTRLLPHPIRHEVLYPRVEELVERLRAQVAGGAAAESPADEAAASVAGKGR